jgi:hypothetical protein
MIAAMNCAGGTERLAAGAGIAAGTEYELAVVEAVGRTRRGEVAVEGSTTRVEDVVTTVNADVSGVGRVAAGIAVAAEVSATGMLRTQGTAVKGDAAGIEGVVAVVAGGRGVAGVEGAAETGAARVAHEPAAVAVAAEAAAFVRELAAEAAGVALGIDAAVTGWAASGIESDVGVGVAKAVGAATVFVPPAELVAAWVVSKIVHEAAVAVVSRTIRKRTAVAGAAGAVAVIARAAFGVAVLGDVVVYGVVVGVAIAAVLADVVNLCLLWLRCRGGVAVIHP